MFLHFIVLYSFIGKPRTSWIGNLTSWTTMNIGELLRSTEDRTGWQQLVRSVTNPRTEEG